MTKVITFIIALVFSLDVSAQARASVSASVTIVDIAGTSFSNNSSNTGNDSISLTASSNDGMTIVRADQTAELGKLSLMGDVTAYSITLPSEPIILSRMSGNEHLTVQSLQVITLKNDSNSLNIIATCQPGKSQAPGFYSSIAPIDIVIDYN